MKKSTGTISLVLLGSALALPGCGSDPRDDEDDRQQAAGHGGYVGTRFVPGFGGGGRTATSTPSVRGGFGGIGSVGVGT